MALNQLPYRCENCDKMMHSKEQIFLIEDKFGHVFCSDGCIVNFYKYLTHFFYEEDLRVRQELGLESETAMSLAQDQKLIEKTLESPDHVFFQNNDFRPDLYFLHREEEFNGEKYYLIVGCLMHDGKPSFVFYQSATQNLSYVQDFQLGEKLGILSHVGSEQQGEGFVDVEISAEQMEELELKKSQFLAELMERKKQADIPPEDYHLYEKYAPDALSGPDEVYKLEDMDGDEVFSYIKFFQEGGVSFYYIVVCYQVLVESQEHSHALYPILSFPSLDPDIYRYFQSEDKITGGQIN